MPPIDTLLIWLGGVVTQTLADVAAEKWAAGVRGHAGVKIRRAVRSLEEDLALGRIGPEEYLRQTMAACGVEPSSQSRADDFLEGVLPRPAVMQFLRQIPVRFSIWLLSQYPQTWHGRVAQRLGTDALVPPERTIYLAEAGLPRMVPDLFDYLVRRTGRTIEHCLLIDHDSPRAVEATRHALPAIIYVYPDRLKHELALQGILSTEEDVMHPSSSKRVKI